MCLILFAVHHHPDYPLVIVANRDENYQRPALPAHFWPETPDLFAGKDLQAGGTWMGITQSGRFAAVTNYRDLTPAPQNAITRGNLCKDFLDTDIDAQQYLANIDRQKSRYAGFNILVGDTQQLFYYSNRQAHIVEVPPGVHGLSNGLLNESWPKVETGKTALREALARTPNPKALQQILLDQKPAEDAKLPNTGIGVDGERLLSSRFIHTEDYGTRNTTVVRADHSGSIDWLEQSFDNNGASSDIQRHTVSS